MDVASCPFRARVPGRFRVRYDETCGAVVEITDGPRIVTPMPPSCPTPVPSPTPISTIRGVSVIESDGTVWTLGSRLETLRNGAHASGGFGHVYKIVNSVVYVLGMDNDWYKWSNGWSWFSDLEPGGVVVIPTPTPQPTPLPTPVATPTPAPSPTPTPRPSPSPSPTPRSKPCKWWQPWKCL